jgi:hypothetical protein
MIEMGRDRTSELEINNFILAIDKDHKGFYRGHQAQESNAFYYRGWHYHIEHKSLSQLQIMQLLESELINMGARRIEWDGKQLGIGNTERKPQTLSYWQLKNTVYNKVSHKFEFETKSCVLWISSFNGKLHIETDKAECFQKGILDKKKLIAILKTSGPSSE